MVKVATCNCRQAHLQTVHMTVHLHGARRVRAWQKRQRRFCQATQGRQIQAARHRGRRRNRFRSLATKAMHSAFLVSWHHPCVMYTALHPAALDFAATTSHLEWHRPHCRVDATKVSSSSLGFTINADAFSACNNVATYRRECAHLTSVWLGVDKHIPACIT
jgi:hypothetical protein